MFKHRAGVQRTRFGCTLPDRVARSARRKKPGIESTGCRNKFGGPWRRKFVFVYRCIERHGAPGALAESCHSGWVGWMGICCGHQTAGQRFGSDPQMAAPKALRSLVRRRVGTSLAILAGNARSTDRYIVCRFLANRTPSSRYAQPSHGPECDARCGASLARPLLAQRTHALFYYPAKCSGNRL